MVNKAEEYELWNKFKDGDDNALSNLYSKYVNQLYSYGLKISKDEYIVKDCIQETFLNLVDKRQMLLISEKTYLYLFKSLRNKIIEELRSNTRKKKIEDSLIFELSSQSQSAEQIIVRSEEENFHKSLIDAAMEGLSDHQREAVFLKYAEDLSYDDIANILDIDIASVRTLIYRTLKKIKEHITKKGIYFFSFILNINY